MNCISVLQKIAEIAETDDGQKVAPVFWECNCLEEVCGACTMLVNGRVRQACTALVDVLLEDGAEGFELVDAVASRGEDLLAAIGQKQVDGDAKGFSHPLNAAFAAKIGKLWRAVQGKAQLVKWQIFGLQRAFDELPTADDLPVAEQ